MLQKELSIQTNMAKKRKIGVGIVVVSPSNKVLMGYNNKKKGYEFPGGKVEAGENITYAAARELREETGLDLKITDDHFVTYIDTQDEYLALVFRFEVHGELVIETPEPQTFSDWRWFSLDELPKDIHWIACEVIRKTLDSSFSEIGTRTK